MAHAAGDAHEYPIYGAHCLVTFPILDADGDPVTGATGLDSEVSKDLGTFTDCTNEATEIATSSGIYYLYVTGAEMTAKVITVQVKTSSVGAKTTVLTLYPRRLKSIASGTATAGGASTITLAASTIVKDGSLDGCYVLITDNSTSGSQYQARRIIGSVASTQVATVESAWGTNPAASSTYDIYAPETVNAAAWGGTAFPSIATAGIPDANTKNLGGTTQTGRDVGASVLLSTGTGTGQLDFTSGVVKANATQILGTAVSTPATAGILDVNLKNIANATVSATTAQLGVNVVNIKGSASAGAAGYAGVDWGQVANPTTTLGLSGTTIKTATDVETATTNIKSRLPAALTAGGMMKSDIEEINALTTYVTTGFLNVAVINTGITSGSFAAGAINAAAIATGAITSSTFASGAITAAAIATDAIGASELAADAVAEIQSGLATSSALSTVGTNVTGIKTKTDFLPSATAGAAGGVMIAGSNAAVTFDSFTVTNAFVVGGAVLYGTTFVVGGATTFSGAVVASDSNNLINLGTASIKEGTFDTTAGSFLPLSIIDQGTAQSATSTTMVLRSAASFGNSTLIGSIILITGGTTGTGSTATISGYVGSTDTATISGWQGATPSGTITYKIFASVAPGSGGGGSGLTAQQTRDAMKLAPSAGTPDEGSIDDLLQNLAASTLTVVSPVSSDGTEIEIFRGDDYYFADGRHISFTLSGAPSISGGSCLLKIGNQTPIAGSITSSTALYFEIGKTVTAAMGSDTYPYEIEITLSNAHVLTPIVGTVTMDGQLPT